ncbi:hypothetical protein Tco_0115197 [Tanacetum coccineum]
MEGCVMKNAQSRSSRRKLRRSNYGVTHAFELWHNYVKLLEDKKATLQDFDGALDLQCVEMASQSSLMLSKLEGDDVTIFCDDVTVADL